MALRIANLLLLVVVVVVSVTLAGDTGRGGRGYYPAFQQSISQWRLQRPWGKPASSEEQSQSQSHSQSHSSSSLSGLGECSSIRYKNKCYFPSTSQESWHTGRNGCIRNRQHLARIESTDEITLLASYLYEGSESNYWIDLNDEQTEGVWKQSDNSAGYTDWWAFWEPNGREDENCGLMEIELDRQGRLHDDNCAASNRYICEQQSSRGCEESGFKRKCYWFSSEEKTWFDAESHCKSIGQRLARVSATDQTDFLARVMPANSWIDVNSGDPDSAGGHTQTWTGREVCRVLRGGVDRNGGRVEQAECDQTKHFICESEPRSGSVYSSGGSANINSVQTSGGQSTGAGSNQGGGRGFGFGRGRGIFG